MGTALERRGKLSSSVKDGKLIKASPSLINSFDPSTPFGCERRGWFKYVAGKEEPSTGNQALGIELHRLNEEFLLGREVKSEIPEALILFELGRAKLVELKSGDSSFHVEHAIETELAGVRVSGFCDFSAPGLVIDWKTTSDIRKYGKKAEELLGDTQMLIYAHSLSTRSEEVSLAHGQYQTRGTPRFNFVEALISKDELDEKIELVIVPKIERIKTLVAESDVTKIDRNTKTCGMCPHRGYCPTKGSEAIMSIFNKYSKSSQQTAIPQILPPDAPASDPQLASDPPPSASNSPPSAPSSPPSAEAPKKRGRPLGSGKKFSDTPNSDVVFEAVTVSYGVTVNLGDYSSARVDVSMTARSADSEAAYAEVLTKVKQKVTEEVAVITESLKGKK